MPTNGSFMGGRVLIRPRHRLLFLRFSVKLAQLARAAAVQGPAVQDILDPQERRGHQAMALPDQLDQPVLLGPEADKEILELLARRAVKVLPDQQVTRVARALLAPQALLAPRARRGPQAPQALPVLREALVQLVIRGLKDQVGRLEIRVLPAPQVRAVA